MREENSLLFAVFFIATTFIIAGLLSTWTQTWFGNQLAGFTSQSDCTKAVSSNFILDQCTYDNTTGNIVMNLENRNSLDLKDLSLSVTYPNDTMQVSLSPTESLTSRGNNTYSATGISSDYSSIRITTQCSDIFINTTCGK